MSVDLIPVAAFAGVGAVAAPLVTWVASKRVVAQPVDCDPAAERRLVATVLGDPTLTQTAFEATGLSGVMFGHTGRAALWDLIVAAHTQGLVGDVLRAEVERQCLDDPVLHEQFKVATAVLAGGDPFGDGPLRDDDAALVVELAEGRDRYRAAAPVVRVDGEQPFMRVWQAPPVLRLVLSAVVCAVAAGAAAWLVLHQAGGTVLEIVALLLLVWLGWFIAVVDHDTMFLDTGGFVVGAAAAWAVTVLACVADGRSGHVVVGVVVAALWAAVFEALNFVYQLLRGVPGQGFGDTLIVLACVGVPTAISGDVLVGVLSVACAAGAAALVSVPLAVMRQRGMQTPFAFGPFLAVGWLLSWPLVVALGLGA